jgi:UDPglucose--hexose-1-phosphate uridylyltransferase
MEFRQNIATREWVLFAPERGRRPEDFRAESRSFTDDRPLWRADCPFCPGGERHTPGETLRWLDAAGRWAVRAFPNGYPAVTPEGTARRRGDPFHHGMSAVGQHEIVAESARHNTTLALQTETEVRQVVGAWKSRVVAFRERPDAEYVVVFKNHGASAGTSLEHPHSQIVSLPVSPWQVRHRMAEAMRFYDDQGECVFCRMLAVEIEDRARIVYDGPHALGFIPYAAYSPFSVWLVPRRHHCCLSRSSEEELDDIARAVRSLMGALYRGLEDPPFNLVLRTATHDQLEVHFFHWYVAIVPRLQKAAGFEMGTGMFINTTLPEDDAAFLRRMAEEAAFPDPLSRSGSRNPQPGRR